MIETIDLSSYSIPDLQKLIIRINQEIEGKRRDEVLKARNDMEQRAAELGLTIEEIINFDRKKKMTKAANKPKYRNPISPEQTWSGRGKRPRWLQEALKSGATLESFKIP